LVNLYTGAFPRRRRTMADMSMSKEKKMSTDMGMMAPNGQGGHLYMQTNETRNVIVHYRRSADGTLTEIERVAAGGRGSGTYKPSSRHGSAPNALPGDR